MRSVLAVVGIVLGLCVAVYTGILLMSVPGVPLWNTLLLPCLFTVSALDTGAALVEIVAVAPKRAVLSNKTHRLLEASVVVLVVLEVVVLAAFLATMQGSDLTTATGATAAASVRLLAQGMLAPFFWLLVGAWPLQAWCCAKGGKAGVRPCLWGRLARWWEDAPCVSSCSWLVCTPMWWPRRFQR